MMIKQKQIVRKRHDPADIKKSLYFVCTVFLSVLIGLMAAHLVYVRNLKQTAAVEPILSSAVGLEESTEGKAGENFFSTNDKDARIVYDTGGAYLDNVEIQVSSFSDATVENEAVLMAEADGTPVYDSRDVVESPWPQHAFSVARKILLDRRVNTLAITWQGEPGVSISVVFNEKDAFPFPLWIIVTLFCFLILSLALGLYDPHKIKVEGCAAMAVLFLGLFCSLYVPARYTWDEESHYIRAYNQAIGNIVYDFDEVKSYPQHLGRIFTDPNWLYRNYEDYINYASYEDLYKMVPTEQRVENTPQVVYTPLPYIPAGIGVAVSRLFRLSVLQSVQLGRFFNVLFFALVAYLAVRIAPRKKWLFFFYFTLPINVFLAASFSVDYFITSLMGLAFAIILYLKEKKSASLREYLCLLAVLCLIPCAKSTYAPAILLILLLNKDALPEKIRPAVNVLISIGLTGAMFLITYLYGNRFGIVHWNQPNVDSAQQIQYILKNPVATIQTFIDTTKVNFKVLALIKYQGFAYVGFVDVLGYLDIAGLFILSLFDVGGDAKNESARVRLTPFGVLGVIGAFLGCYLLSLLALYVTFTEIGADLVNGFQGRYCIPIIFIAYAFIAMMITPFRKHRAGGFRAAWIISRVPVIVGIVLLAAGVCIYLKLFSMFIPVF